MKVNKQQPEWWDDDCDRAKSNKFYLLGKFRHTNSALDFNHYKTAKSSLNRLVKLKDLNFKRQNEMSSLNVVKIHNSIGNR